MKIAVESDVLAHNAKTGVYFYVQRLLKTAMSLDMHNTYDLVFFGKSRDAQTFGLPKDKYHVNAITGFPRKLHSLLVRASVNPPIDVLSRTHADIFVFPTFARWPLAHTKHSITIVYDTVYADRPDDIATKHYQRYLTRAIPQAVSLSSRIITISEYAKQRLIALCNAPAEKIEVITPAVDLEQFHPAGQEEIERVRTRYGITRKYLLYLGTIEPRKNIAGIIQAYAELPPEVRRGYQLVLAGGKGWHNSAIEEIAARVSPEDLLRVGYVANEDIAALYSGASIFLYPSFFEGWGMQPLEAMACGTPVITSNNSSLPEVVGDAGIMVDASDTTALSKEIVRLIDDPALAQTLAKKGVEQASRFSWEGSAKKLLSLFEDIATDERRESS